MGHMLMLMSMITQRRLAELAGVTQSAVSLALRGHPRIHAETRRRIESLAEEHGYHRDALVSALSLRRWSRPTGPLVYLESTISRAVPGGDNYWKSVQQRCRALGLSVQSVPPARRGDAQLTAELVSAGVRGLIVGQDTSAGPPWMIEWPQFAVVHCGMFAAPEAGDVVAADLFTAAISAWRALQERGYERVAAVMPVLERSLSEQMLASALLTVTRIVGDPRRLSAWIGSPGAARTMTTWLRRQRAQAVLGYGDGMREVLLRAGIDLPYAALACGEHRPTAAGVVIPFGKIGARAVDLLMEKMQNGAVGRASGRIIHLVEMPWRDGDTLPDLT